MMMNEVRTQALDRGFVAQSPAFLDSAAGNLKKSRRVVEKHESALRAVLCLIVVIFPLCFPAISQQFKDPNLLAAEDYLKKGNFPKAVEAVELALTLDPKVDPDAYLMLGVALVNLKENPRALEALETGLEQFPKAVRLEQHYVSLLQRMGMPLPEVRQKLELRLKKAPGSLVLEKALGEALMKENPLSRQAQQLLEGVVQASPRDAEAHYLLGQWFCSNNKTEVCRAEMQKALQLAPAGNAPARLQIYLTLAGAESRLGHPAEAEAAYKKALEINRALPSPNPTAAYLYVKFLNDHSRGGETRPLVDEILKCAPGFGPARLERARFLSKEGKLEAALEDALEGLKDPRNDPDDLRALHSFLAKTYFSLGKTEEAKLHQDWLKTNLK
jgi:tetratricopeptide (TPR) repeat protein